MSDYEKARMHYKLIGCAENLSREGILKLIKFYNDRTHIDLEHFSKVEAIAKKAMEEIYNINFGIGIIPLSDEFYEKFGANDESLDFIWKVEKKAKKKYVNIIMKLCYNSPFEEL